MMRSLRFCREWADKYMELEPKEKTELCHKAKDATVFPAKRRSVKKMICCCIIHCICGKCLKNKTKTVSPSTATASNSNSKRNSVCSCSPPQPT